jgi:tRNA modification GTPase
MLVLNKMDRVYAPAVARWEAVAEDRGLVTAAASAAQGSVEAVETTLKRRVVESLTGSEAPAVTRLRHREALETALAQVERALSPHRAAELVAEDVRLAARALARLSGRVGAEDVLDKVFSSFCLGK